MVDKRNRIIAFKVNEEEFNIIVEASKRDSRTISSFIRKSSLIMAKKGLENDN